MTFALALLLLCGAMVAGWVWLRPAETTPELAASPAHTQRAAERSRTRRVPATPPRALAPDDAPDASSEPAPRFDPQCVPHASKACHRGDVYWFDSCGRPTERIEACGLRPCFEVACAPAQRVENRCGSITAYGRCDGELAQACVAGEVMTVDCARTGRRCIAGVEGVRCERPSDALCTGREPARCEGSSLVQCHDGSWDVIDCARRGAECVVRGGEGHCVALPGAEAPAQLPVELCNERDDDADGKTDEDHACEPVALVALRPEGAELNDLDARMQRELEIANRVYAPRRFYWERVMQAPSQLARFPTRQLTRVSERIHAMVRAELGSTFFIPVVMADSLDMDPPKGGISMLPNNRCGGVRAGDGRAPVSGLIVLAQARMPETLAHELGHFLGLCHTHEQVERYARFDPNAPACELTGDGICDTAFDPGPSACRADATCTVLCDDASAQPLGVDVMSYYLGCRLGLTAEQLREAERNLSLRRGWARCPDAAACPCEPGDATRCPAEMSCRPAGEQGFSCQLDGASVVGAGCRDAVECGSGALCLKLGEHERGHCVRACRESSVDCECVDAALAFKVCKQDFGF